MVVHARRAVLEAAHALVNHVDEVLQHIRHRRVDGVAGAFGIDAAHRDAFLRQPVLQIQALGGGDMFGEDVDLLVHPRAAAIERVDEFLEVEQPERQLQVGSVDHMGARAEAAAVFVVAVEQNNAQVGPRFHDLVEDDRHAARLADAGRAEDREVARHQPIDHHPRGDVFVVMQRADGDAALADRRIDELEFVAPDDVDLVANRRIIRDAAGKKLGAVGAEGELAHQIDLGDDAETLVRVVARDFRDHADQLASARLDVDERADGGPRLVGVDRRRKPHQRLRAAHAQDIADGAPLRSAVKKVGSRQADPFRAATKAARRFQNVGGILWQKPFRSIKSRILEPSARIPQ